VCEHPVSAVILTAARGPVAKEEPAVAGLSDDLEAAGLEQCVGRRPKSRVVVDD
jgi:hypothetical protein